MLDQGAPSLPHMLAGVNAVSGRKVVRAGLSAASATVGPVCNVG
jgi:hypothetical protein